MRLPSHEDLGIDTAQVFSLVRDKYATLQRRFFVSGGASWPAHVFFLITARCNLACEMCYLIHQGSLNTGRSGELTRDEIRSVIDHTAPFTIITYSGGEPFVRRDFLEILGDTARRRRTYVITNGTRLDAGGIAQLVACAPRHALSAGLMAVGISLIGPSDLHDDIVAIPGSFERVHRSFAGLREERRRQDKKYPLLNLKIVITARSAPRLLDMIPVIEAWQPDVVTLQLESSNAYSFYDPAQTQAEPKPFDVSILDTVPPDVPGLEPVELARILAEFEKAWGARRHPRLVVYPQTSLQRLPRQLRGMPDLGSAWCAALWTDVMIGPWGDVTTCLVGSIGNVRDRSLRQLMNDAKFKEFRRVMRERRVTPACRGCCMLRDPAS